MTCLEYITAFMRNLYLSNSTETELAEENPENSEEVKASQASLIKAIEAYRKLKESKKELTESELAQLDKECKLIEKREIIESDSKHEPIELELTGKGKIQIGPPTLTKFEEAERRNTVDEATNEELSPGYYLVIYSFHESTEIKKIKEEII